MKTPLATFLLTASLLVACSGDATEASSGTPDPGPAVSGTPASAPAEGTAATTTVIATPEVHDAICGHVLDGVGRCGNYVKIDGAWVVLEWPDLGVMEYCKEAEKGAKVEITGEMRDGRFVAKTYRRVE